MQAKAQRVVAFLEHLGRKALIAVCRGGGGQAGTVHDRRAGAAAPQVLRALRAGQHRRRAAELLLLTLLLQMPLLWWRTAGCAIQQQRPQRRTGEAAAQAGRRPGTTGRARVAGAPACRAAARSVRAHMRLHIFEQRLQVRQVALQVAAGPDLQPRGREPAGSGGGSGGGGSSGGCCCRAVHRHLAEATIAVYSSFQDRPPAFRRPRAQVKSLPASSLSGSPRAKARRRLLTASQLQRQGMPRAAEVAKRRRSGPENPRRSSLLPDWLV